MYSSDLWVAGSVPDAKETGKNSGVNYAIGSVKGPLLAVLSTRVVRSSSCVQVPVKLAALNFTGYVVSDQAFSKSPSQIHCLNRV
jgi:hypothetical protein